MADLKPNRRALSGCMWIGFMSPDTEPYRRPRSPASVHVAVAGRSSARGSCEPGALAPSDPWPRRRLVEISSQTNSSPTRASETSENCLPRGWSSSGVGPDRYVHALETPDRPVLSDPVGDVHQSDGREREARVGHQRELEREGEDVRVSGGDRVALRSNPHTRLYAAEPVENRPRRRAASERGPGRPAPRPPTNGRCEAPGIIAAPARANSGSIDGDLSRSRVVITHPPGSDRTP